MFKNNMKYVWAAFNATFWGIFFPPNWAFLALVAVFGFIEPGLILIGLGLEIGYLWLLSSDEKFRKHTDAKSEPNSKSNEEQIREMLNNSGTACTRYFDLSKLCSAIIKDYGKNGSIAMQLNDMLWVFLDLLKTKGELEKISKDSKLLSLYKDLESLHEQIKSARSEDLKKAILNQKDVIQSRIDKRKEVDEKTQFVNLELDRIEHHMHLLKEQHAVSATPDLLCNEIDMLANSLSDTGSWVSEQQKTMNLYSDNRRLKTSLLST